MKFFSDKEKVYLEKEFRPLGMSFSKSTFEDDDDNTITFYLYCIDDSSPDRYRNFIDILDINSDNETITFNYYLTKGKIKEVLDLIIEMDEENKYDKYVINGLYKLIGIMCTEYKYSHNDIKELKEEYFEMKDGTFSEVMNSISMYFEKYNRDRLQPSSSSFFEEEPEIMNEEDDLEEFAVNLNTIDYKYDPAVGREDEIKDALVSLMQGSCILVGFPGVGKTAIAEGIAYRIKNGLVPESLRDKEIYQVSATELVSGCRYVGDLEEKMKNILNDVMLRENVILFFDEMHTAIGTGKGSDGTLDIANIIKPYLDRGQIKMIGATTKDEYDEHISKDPAFRRRLEKLIINEPTNEKLYKIIDSYINGEEIETKVKFEYSKKNRDLIINKLIELTDKSHRNYIDIEYNPGLVISIIKKAFGYALYYEHSSVEITDITEAVEKCSYLYQPIRDRFKGLKANLSKEEDKKELKKVLAFPKRV